MSKLSSEEVRLLSALELIGGTNGTVKIHGTDAITTPFKAICFSEATTITAISDTNNNTKTEYFKDTTYTANAGDILVAHGMNNGVRFVSIELASGSALGIL